MNAKNPNTVPNKEKDRQNVNIEINVAVHNTHEQHINYTKKEVHATRTPYFVMPDLRRIPTANISLIVVISTFFYWLLV